MNCMYKNRMRWIVHLSSLYFEWYLKSIAWRYWMLIFLLIVLSLVIWDEGNFNYSFFPSIVSLYNRSTFEHPPLLVYLLVSICIAHTHTPMNANNISMEIFANHKIWIQIRNMHNKHLNENWRDGKCSNQNGNIYISL